MGKWKTAFTKPTLVQGQRVANNSGIAPATGLRRVAQMYNSVSTNHRKLVCVRANRALPTPADADESNHYFIFQTGENVQRVVAHMGLQQASSTNGTNRAYCELVLYDGTNTITSSAAILPTVASSNLRITWHKVDIDIDDTVLAANTIYRGYIRQYHYCRVRALTVYEEASKTADSSVTGVCDPSYWETNKPIFDAGAQDLAQTGQKLWQHNGAHLFSYSRQDAANAITLTDATEKNLLDTSVTGGTWSATSPGFVLNTQYHDTHSKDVPIRFAFLGGRTAGTGEVTIRLKRNGSTIATLTSSGTVMSPVQYTDTTITARASDKVDITVQGAASTTWRIDAVCIWEYEA